MADDSEWEKLLTLARDHALLYRRSLATRQVAPSATIEDVQRELDEMDRLPLDGCSAEQVLSELVEWATPGVTAMSGPRFFGWVTGGTLPAAVGADWLTSIWDQNAGPATGAPAAAAFEMASLRWVIERLALPAAACGALVTGAMSANFVALAAARSHVLKAAGWDVEQQGLFQAPPVRVFVGHERHDSIDKAVRLLGLGKEAMGFVDVDREGRLSSSALQRKLKTTIGPVIVCAQAGNVNSGAFDPLDEIGAALAEHRAHRREHDSWLHVDGAFGLWARASRSYADLARGAELADSWATDAHKFLNVPYDCGIVLTRHPRAHRRAMAIHGPYLSSGAEGTGSNPGVFAPELSRRARGFALWAALRQLGSRGLDELVTRCCELARLLAGKLGVVHGMTILNEVVFNQVVVKLKAPAGYEAEDWTRRMALAIQTEGTCYPTPTIWRATPALRFSIVNCETSADDIARSAAAVINVYEEHWGREMARPTA
ncbi:MAG TPA: pyridoxal-dependent decarboxylase [Polyangiaceae bacterium]|nr:pyridoxal-dependent decarboxylase [Polyangiaceae bacterium]